jgi:hypothetical protein
MRIFIEVKPYSAMRYPTLGDWYEDGHGAKIDVADLGDWRMNLLVAVHEMVESALCEHRGIAEEVVRAFDEAHLDADDPGSLADAPYRAEHMFAESLERQIAAELGVDWDVYEAKCKEVAR